MIILGIDPGIATTGYGLVSYEGNYLKKIGFGVIRTLPDQSTAQRLNKLYQELQTIILDYKPEVMAIEELFFNRNVRTALAVGQARGVGILAAATSGIEIAEYTPLQVKLAVVGYGRADKQQVQEMVRRLLCLSELPKPDDAADALAIAICHAHSYKLNIAVKNS
jgi:crossover junction endodeoxyribonuclease RuvC